MIQRMWRVGMLAGMICAGAAGCATQDDTAQKSKGSYAQARNMQVGSNIPQPNRGVNGTNDTAGADLEREQYMHQSQMGSLGAGPGMGGGGAGGR